MNKTPLNRLVSLYKGFKKPRTTIYVIVVLAILFLLGLFIPQKMFFKNRAHYDEWLASSPYLHNYLDVLGLTDVYVAPVTLFFLALFFLNLILVILDRVPILMKRAYLGKDAMPDFDMGTFRRGKGLREIETDIHERNKLMKLIEKYFRAKGWYLLKNEEDGRALAVKNRLVVFGFLLFHLSFFLILAGGLMIFYTRTSGYLVLSEGESYRGGLTQFRQIHRKAKVMEEIGLPLITVEKVDMHFTGKKRADLFVTLSVLKDGARSREVIGVNQPLVIGNTSILAHNAGVTPLFILRDIKKDEELDGRFISLNVFDGKIDNFSFPNFTGIVFDTWFYPDYVKEGGYETSRSPEIKNPAFHVLVKGREGVIAEATIKKGEGIIFNDYMLVFKDLRRWCEFLVVRETGPPLLVSGFALGIMGLMMRLILYRREIRIAVDGGRICMKGKSDLNQLSFEDEVDEIAKDLRDLTDSK